MTETNAKANAKANAKGMALVIGVEHVDETKYRGWSGKLNCTSNDANAIAELAKEKGFSTTLLLTSDATTHGVKEGILHAASELESGDIFFMYYSGHGGSTNDKSADEAGDGKDETLCLYDAQLLDDELYVLWPHFAAGVRVLVVADCCHSGSMTRNAVDDDLVVRAMDERSANRLMRADPERYSRVRSGLETGGEISATVKLISGCQDHQQSFEAKSLGHGQMTSALLAVMKEGSVQSYADIHAAILEKMPEYQQPNLFEIGTENLQFNSEAPFTI